MNKKIFLIFLWKIIFLFILVYSFSNNAYSQKINIKKENRILLKEKNKEKKANKKAEEKLKKLHFKSQTKDVQKRMKQSSKIAKRNRMSKRAPFFYRINKKRKFKKE